MSIQSQAIKTTCPYCGVGCGVVITPDDNGEFRVKGDPAHPANRGLLCSKGSALAETLSLDGRLLYPQIKGNTVAWDDAIAAVASGLKQTIESHGPDSVAFYVSGQLLTEDYYVANKLMKGFIGSANIDTNSRLCMSSAVAGHKRAFGSDTVPGCYEDLELADLLVLVGSNTAWCHPVIYQRIVTARKQNPNQVLVVIDPRRTATSQSCDLHLALQSGTDQVLFNGLFKFLYDTGMMHHQFVENHTQGFSEIINTNLPDVPTVAQECGLSVTEVLKFYSLFAQHDSTVTLFSQGINQWSYGTDRVNAIINVHLLTGRMGKPGSAPFSITGQPNAMGGREVGGLANQLAAHMDFNTPEHWGYIQKFWQTDSLAKTEGLKAVDMFREIHSGKIKAVWIMATNPAVSLPDSTAVRQALSRCELVIVSDCVQETDTTRYAHILLPAQTWGERNGTVTNSERCISRQRPFLAGAGEAKPDWWIISQVGRKMGFPNAFKYESAHEIFNEHATLSGLHNTGLEAHRDFDISGLMDLSVQQYDELAPLQWPVKRDLNSGLPLATKRMFTDGRFFTANGKARFVHVGAHKPVVVTSIEYPYTLNTGRIRDQWHTMTRTSKSPRLLLHINEPFVEINPHDASDIGVLDNQLVTLQSVKASITLRARLEDNQQRGTVFMPIHWNDRFSANAVACRLIEAHADPVSGQPEFKSTPVKLKPFQATWYGFVLSKRELAIEEFDYWAQINCSGVIRYELAGLNPVADWSRVARKLLCTDSHVPEWIEYFDLAKICYRAARIDVGRLDSCLFVTPEHRLPDKNWLMQLFDHPLQKSDRKNILAAKSSNAVDQGPVICSCFNVGLNPINALIENQNLQCVEQIGEVLKAGTNCGSCKPELQKLLAKRSETLTKISS
ncbi:MAG: molybdopterin-dependent oxidoreductase [Gammaproteobacteria bacterium]|nr:molybdopterin-dependent oxidoreductase [Gammaproteobacteria bacterium]MDH5802096.1 molybdopterin-dependent oxidoreductase [Gammaproteobacteria bacterium]